MESDAQSTADEENGDGGRAEGFEFGEAVGVAF
jgi:hypothetical protein